jgi:adenylate kinase
MILFGSPGSGKGTQARLLQNCLKGPHISTGDMLRVHIQLGDRIGQESERLIKSGRLVPDELVNELIEERLQEPDTRSGVILDGYPRTTNQAEVLLGFLSVYGFRPGVVHLMVDYEIIVARLSGRRQCPVCGTLYSLKTNPPKNPGICDLDGTPLVTREDDRESVIRERLEQYDLQTRPLLDFFRKANVPMVEVDAAKAAPKDISLQILGELSSAGIIPKVNADCVEGKRTSLG